MNEALLLRQPLINHLIPSRQHPLLRYVVLYVLGIAALTLSAKTSIPLLPVPITLQTFVVLFLGMVYGWRLGSITVASYVLLGALGVPVFASVLAGPSILFGPTGGYLLGFLPAAFLSGVLVEYGWGRYHFTALLSALIGMAVIYVYGIFWLAKFVGFHQALVFGFMPFLMGCLMKLLALALVVPKFWKLD